MTELAVDLDPVVFGANVRAAREAKGLTRFDLGVASNMRENTVYRIETGQNLPSLDGAVRLAQALDTTLDELTKGGE
jgi:transcriptional regulator with XRE-family HTH domain